MKLYHIMRMMKMKKILLTLACVFGMSITASAEQSAAVLLEHAGKITTFEPEKINDAIAVAEDGDVITLTAGDFPGFTIDKQISVRGSGMQTVMKGSITIKNTEIKLNDVFIGYLNFATDCNINVNSPVKGLKISQCRINSDIEFRAITEDSYIDRCYIGGSSAGLGVHRTYTETVTVDGHTSEYTYSYVKSLTVTNSVILKIYSTSERYVGISFINCYIKAHQAHLGGVKVVNSILMPSISIFLYGAELVNSSYGGVTLTDCTLSNCYEVNIDDNTSDDLVANGYLGNDGTVIGPMGGNTPYTLNPTLPHVTKSEMKLDPKKQELNATLTISPK